MAFPGNILETGIKIADGLIPGLKGDCILKQFIGSDANGDLIHTDGVDGRPNPIPFKAIVDYTNKVTIRNAQMISISATLTILETIPFNNTLTDPPRKNPIDPRDEIILPDGSTGPIISAPGSVHNPRTGTGFIQVVEIGPRS